MEYKLTQSSKPRTLDTTTVDISPSDCASTPSPMQTGSICASDKVLWVADKAVAICVVVYVVRLSESKAVCSPDMVMSTEEVTVVGVALLSTPVTPPVEDDVSELVAESPGVNEGVDAREEDAVGFDDVVWDDGSAEELPNAMVESEEVVHQNS